MRAARFLAGVEQAHALCTAPNCTELDENEAICPNLTRRPPFYLCPVGWPAPFVATPTPAVARCEHVVLRTRFTLTCRAAGITMQIAAVSVRIPRSHASACAVRWFLGAPAPTTIGAAAGRVALQPSPGGRRVAFPGAYGYEKSPGRARVAFTLNVRFCYEP